MQSQKKAFFQNVSENIIAMRNISSSSCEQKDTKEEEGEPPNRKKRFRAPVAGRKRKAVAVRAEMFDWFLDISGALPSARMCMVNGCSNKPIPVEDQLKFGNMWLGDWLKEYNTM